jgi:hypothetical protein
VVWIKKNPMEWWDVDGKKADGTLVEVEYGSLLFFLSSRDFNNTDRNGRKYGVVFLSLLNCIHGPTTKSSIGRAAGPAQYRPIEVPIKASPTVSALAPSPIPSEASLSLSPPSLPPILSRSLRVGPMAAATAQQKTAAAEQEEVEHGPFPIEQLQVPPRPPHRNPLAESWSVISHPDVVLKVEPSWGFLSARWRIVAGFSRPEVADWLMGCAVLGFLGGRAAGS